uniref:Protein naked cuticle homolog n=1 Tax=Trichuris muris TaxID=70415 RepID=A0A5S6QE04_TRIMR
MKRPFGIGSVKSLKFAGAFGSCDDDDKVQLLALMSHSDSSSSSSDSSCDSMHSLDGNESATGSEEDCYETIFKDVFPNKAFHHCDHACNPNAESLYRRQNKCDAVVSKLVDEQEKQEEPCEPNPHTTDKQAKAPAAGQEWVFTLYDFDGKGKVSKEDILSLVRSIYDVLGNAKLPIHNGGGNDTSHKSGQPVGAFKIKLSVMPDIICPTANQKEIKVPRTQRNVKPQKVIPERKADVPEQQCDRSKNVKNYDVVGHTALRVYRRSLGNGCPGGGGGMSHAETKFCVSCNHRDYVNLSELENCCRDRHSCSGNVIHHIRHCDRHCHCPPIVHFSRNASNVQCYERLKRASCGMNEVDYAPLRLPQTSCCKEQECIYNRLLAAPTVDKKNQTPLVRPSAVGKQPDKKAPTAGHTPKVLFKAVPNHSVTAASKQSGKSGRPEHAFQPAKPSEPTRGDADGCDLFLEHRHYHEHHHYYYNC